MDGLDYGADFPKPSQSLVRIVNDETISLAERQLGLRLWILMWWVWKSVPRGTLISEWLTQEYLNHFARFGDEPFCALDLFDIDISDMFGCAFRPCLGDMLFVRQSLQKEGQQAVARFYLEYFDLYRAVGREGSGYASDLWILGQAIGVDERWLPSLIASGTRSIIPELVAPLGRVDYESLCGDVTLEWGGARDESMDRDRALRVLGFDGPTQRYRWPDGVGQKEYAEAYRGGMKLLHPDIVHVLGPDVQLRANLASVRLRSCYEALR